MGIPFGPSCHTKASAATAWITLPDHFDAPVAGVHPRAQLNCTVGGGERDRGRLDSTPFLPHDRPDDRRASRRRAGRPVPAGGGAGAGRERHGVPRPGPAARAAGGAQGAALGAGGGAGGGAVPAGDPDAGAAAPSAHPAAVRLGERGGAAVLRDAVRGDGVVAGPAAGAGAAGGGGGGAAGAGGGVGAELCPCAGRDPPRPQAREHRVLAHGPRHPRGLRHRLRPRRAPRASGSPRPAWRSARRCT